MGDECRAWCFIQMVLITPIACAYKLRGFKLKFFNKLFSALDLLRGNRFVKKAGKSKPEKADIFFSEAYRRFGSAIAKNPERFEAYRNWGHALFNSAKKKTRKDQWRAYRNACEKYEAAYRLNASDFETLKFWGLALKGQAKNKHEENPESLFKELYQKFEKAAEVAAENEDIFYHWGLTLYQEAGKKKSENSYGLYEQACDKFSRSHAIRADQTATLIDWGAALMALANLSSEPEKDQLLAEAEEKFLTADAIRSGIASYNQACLESLRGNSDACRKHLETAQQNWRLPSSGLLENDPDLKYVRNTDWFKEIAEKARRSGL